MDVVHACFDAEQELRPALSFQKPAALIPRLQLLASVLTCLLQTTITIYSGSAVTGLSDSVYHIHN